MLQSNMAIESLILQRALERSFATREPLKFTSKTLTFGLHPSLKSKTQKIEGSATDFVIRFQDGRERELQRYDFLREWNNLGYGLVDFAEGPFNLSTWQILESSKYEPIAEVFDRRSGNKVSDYMGIIDHGDHLEFWCLRSAGPVDGFDWRFVEDFVSVRDIEKFGGCPVVREVPSGYDAGVFMRIDCDEAIESGRELFELYRSHEMPFSMAIKTDQNISAADLDLIRDVVKSGGSIVSHSHTHANDWGMNGLGPAMEIHKSHEIFRSWKIDGLDFEYVVSPFHQNSVGALTALYDAGIKGFIGGIACNDPEALIYRSGLAATPDPLVTISTQCMLHGDCYHAQGSALNVEKTALRDAVENQKLFGYLDHPLSGYNYGWNSKEEQLTAHKDFLKTIKTYKNIWTPNLVDALRFTRARSRYRVEKIDAARCQLSSEFLPVNKPTLSLSLSLGSKTWSEEI